MKRSTLTLRTILLLLIAIASCTTDGPTGSTSISETATAPSAVASGRPSAGVADVAAAAPFNTASGQQADEEFNCTHLQDRSVRFSDPGFVHQNVAGLYYKYEGVPTGRTLLELFWDEANQPSAFQRLDLGGGDIQRDDDSRTDYEGLVTHTYSGISEATAKVVRANLISYGRTGNCATVRHITVFPGDATSTPGQSCTLREGTFASEDTQLGRLFRNAVASGCDGKAYPGLYNATTSYFYETFSFQASGAGCVRVNFDPNSGSNPCGTNAHASAYILSYDPDDQSKNYVGDVGASLTQSFEFPAKPGVTFQVVVTNTNSQSNCSYTFTVENASCK